MNYIIFDLEWNQTYGGSELENPRMPFEIIEIGAIKLNSNFEIIHILVLLSQSYIRSFNHILSQF